MVVVQQKSILCAGPCVHVTYLLWAISSKEIWEVWDRSLAIACMHELASSIGHVQGAAGWCHLLEYGLWWALEVWRGERPRTRGGGRLFPGATSAQPGIVARSPDSDQDLPSFSEFSVVVVDIALLSNLAQPSLPAGTQTGRQRSGRAASMIEYYSTSICM